MIKSLQDTKSYHLNHRKLSLFEKSHSDSAYSYRQHLKQKYHKYLELKNRSLEHHHSIDNISERSMDPTDPEKMPKINCLIRDRTSMGDMFRETINHYKYTKHLNEKKAQELYRKKTKYEKIMKIRQDHLMEKMELKKSKIQLERSFEEEKQSLKNSVVRDKQHINQSMIRSLLQKQQTGHQLRKIERANKNKIAAENEQELNRKKRQHSEIQLGEKQAIQSKKMFQMKKKRIATEEYYNRVSRELQKNKKLHLSLEKSSKKVSKMVNQLSKSKEAYEHQINHYRYLLKEDFPNNKKHLPKGKKILLSTSTAMAYSQQV